MNSTFEIHSSVHNERTEVSVPNGPLLASLDDRGITFSLSQDPSTMDPMSRGLVIGAFHGLGTTMSLAPVFVPFSKVETLTGVPEFWFRSEEDLDRLSEEDFNRLLKSAASEPSVILVYKNDNGERVELSAHCEADHQAVELYHAILSRMNQGPARPPAVAASLPPPAAPGHGIEQATEVHRPPNLWRAIGELAIGIGVLAYLWFYVSTALRHLDACEFNGLIWECVYRSGRLEFTDTIYVPVAIVAGLGGLLAVTRGVIGIGRAAGAVPSGVRSWRASEPRTRRISLLSSGALVLGIIPYTAPFGILVALVTLRQINRASTDVGTPHGGSFQIQGRRARIGLWVGFAWVVLIGGTILNVILVS